MGSACSPLPLRSAERTIYLADILLYTTKNKNSSVSLQRSVLVIVAVAVADEPMLTPDIFVCFNLHTHGRLMWTLLWRSSILTQLTALQLTHAYVNVDKYVHTYVCWLWSSCIFNVSLLTLRASIFILLYF